MMSSMINRSCLYGDGFFETIRLRNGQWLLLDQHVNRIRSGIRTFQLHTTHIIDMTWLEKECEKALIELPKESQQNAVVRMDFFRRGERGYVPKDDQMHVLCTVHPFTGKDGIFPEAGEPIGAMIERVQATSSVPAGICRTVCKSQDMFSHLKTTSALTYVQAARECAERDEEDLILLNDAGRVCDFISSSFLAYHHSELIAIPDADGPIRGTMVDHLNELYDVKYRSFRPDQLRQLDMLLRCNSVRGIELVDFA